MLHQIKAQQFYTVYRHNNFILIKVSINSAKSYRKFKDFLRLLSDFPVLFKADLFFKDYLRKPSKFKYFSSLCEPLIFTIKFVTVS